MFMIFHQSQFYPNFSWIRFGSNSGKLGNFLWISPTVLRFSQQFSTWLLSLVYCLDIGVEDQDIQISGDTKFAVAMACNRIDAIVSSARQRQGFTHFISVPCNSIEMQTSYKGMCSCHNFLLVSSNLPKNQRNFFQDFCPSLQKGLK